MATPEAASGVLRPALDEARWVRRRRWAATWWAVAVFFVWNVAFDAVVIQAGRDYLTQQALHAEGRAPAITVPEAMRPAVRHGLWLASEYGGGMALVGAFGIGTATRRRRARSSARSGQ
jgi:hypothetical protein